MKKKYRYLFTIPVILLCTLFGCRKGQNDLIFEDTEKIIEENKEENEVPDHIAEDPETGYKEENDVPGSMADHAEELQADDESEERNAKAGEAAIQQSCVVHVCGAVEQPGVYELPPESRIYQAIVLAGGMNADADPDFLNQADYVFDGEKIYVPTREETEQMDTRQQTVTQPSEGTAERLTKEQTGNRQKSGETETSGLVNLNTASEEQLCTLPGIGSSKAKSIIAYREEHGSFDRIEGIMNVAGIKDGLFQKIKAYITV